jgi:hypothetical protein
MHADVKTQQNPTQPLRHVRTNWLLLQGNICCWYRCKVMVVSVCRKIAVLTMLVPFILAYPPKAGWLRGHVLVTSSPTKHSKS